MLLLPNLPVVIDPSIDCKTLIIFDGIVYCKSKTLLRYYLRRYNTRKRNNKFNRVNNYPYLSFGEKLI